MTDDEKVQFRNEGEPAFDDEAEDGNSAGETTGETENGDTVDSSADGEKKPDAQKQKDIPFDQRPEWAEREKKWDERFNQQESRHQEDMKKLLEKAAPANSKGETPPIASWFGGDQEQWEQYLADEDAKAQRIEERAAKRITETREQEAKAVEEATSYMRSEISAIEADPALNPSGAKIDPNKLLAIVMDKDGDGKYPLIDAAGRWNYRAGVRIMLGGAQPKKPTADKKILAGATTTDGKTETKPAPFKTSADFKKSKPW